MSYSNTDTSITDALIHTFTSGGNTARQVEPTVIYDPDTGLPVPAGTSADPQVVQAMTPTATDKGYVQVTALSAAVGLTVPEGATQAIIRCEAQPVRWRMDGDPSASVGYPLLVGEELVIQGETSLGAIRFIEQAASAKLNVSFSRLDYGRQLSPLILSATHFAAGAAAGTTIAAIGNKTVGSALSITPNDGRVVLQGDDTFGWSVVTGATAWTVDAPVDYTITESLPGDSNTPLANLFTLTAASLTRFKAALAAAKAGTGDVTIWFQGESSTSGVGAHYTGSSSDTGAMASAWPNTPAHLLAADYTAQASTVGINAEEMGIIGTQLLRQVAGTPPAIVATYTEYDGRLTFGSWTASSGVGYMSSAAAGAPLTFNFGTPANRLDLVLRNTAPGSFDVIVGGTTIATITSSTAAADTFKTVTLPAGTTSVSFNWVSGNAQIYAIQPRNTLVKQMYIFKNGWPTHTLNSTISTDLTNHYQPLSIIANWKPNLVIIDSYIADATASTPVDQPTYDASLQAYIDAARNNGGDALLVFGHHTSAAEPLQAPYKATMQAVAARNGVPMLDLQSKPEFSTYALQVSGGMMDGGSVNLGQAGYAKKEQYIRQFLGLA